MRRVLFITLPAGRALRLILASGFLSCVLYVVASGYPIDGFVDNWNIDTSDLEHSCRIGASAHNDNGAILPPHASASAPNDASRSMLSRDTADMIPATGQGTFTDRQEDYRNTPPRVRDGKLNKIILIFAGFTGLMIPFARKRYFEAKRIFDIVGSIFLLSILSPLMLVVAFLIKLDSPGPVFYKQIRVGVNRRKQRAAQLILQERRGARHFGKPFTIYKFRTMRIDAESQTGPVWAKENDNRVTRVGNVLRKTRLDELPQFINVLRGDMCVIGPRPERPVFINQLNDHLPNYAERLQIKPGITGLAQVRYQYAASIEDAKIKLRYDLVYVKKMCIWLDIGILLNTFNVVLLAKGAR